MDTEQKDILVEDKKESDSANWTDGLNEMCAALAKTDDISLINDFLNCLLTPAELHDIGNRWQLVKEIRKGTTQREVARMFGMSLCKITRGSRELKKPGSAFLKMIQLME